VSVAEEDFKQHSVAVWRAMPLHRRVYWTLRGKRPTPKRLDAVVSQIKAQQALTGVAFDGFDR
jgi:hypothetical protein